MDTALFVGHSVGDHWVQTQHQAMHKHHRNRSGQWNCLKHVATLTLTKLALLLPVLALSSWPNVWLLCLGLTFDAASHYWADRRYTLEAVATWLNKAGFYHLGTDTVHIDSPAGSHIGTGKYALDQAFHLFWIFVSSVLISL